MKSIATPQNQTVTVDKASPDCEQVVSLLDTIIDGEATPEEKTFFFTHVETCQECFGAHNKHQQLKSVLKDSIKRRVVPTNLLSSIQAVIRATA